MGSLPDTDPALAWRTVHDTVGGFPFVPELPARGPGADMIGRATAVCADLPVDLQPAGWRLVARPGRESRRAADLLARDLDAAEVALEGYQGPLGMAVCGPWTLAAALELGRGGPALGDPGAVRDIAAALSEGVADLVGQLRRRVPGALIVVGLDEPTLPAVLAGHIHTASGFATVRAVESGPATAALAGVLSAATAAGAVPSAHCCAADPPLALFRAAGARAIGADLALLGRAELDVVGECVDAGVGILAGVLPTVEVGGCDRGVVAAVARVREVWRRLGFDPATLTGSMAFSPACGLAGATPAVAARILRAVAEVARRLADEPQVRG